MTALLSDDLLARRLERDAREVLARDYTWDGIAQRTVEVYARAVREERTLQADLGLRVDQPLRLVVRDGNLLADRP